MRYLKSVLITSIALLLNSCGNDKLDNIAFVDDFEYVQKSIIEFDSLLTYSNRNCKANYSFEFEEDDIELGDLIGGEYVEIKLKAVCPEAKMSMDRLCQLMRVLKRNNITYVYKLYNTNLSVFGYYYSYSTHGHELREIIIDRNSNKEIMNNGHEMVNERGKLLLFAMKE